VIPWVVVPLLTFGSTGAAAIKCHVSYSDDWNALPPMSEQPKQHLQIRFIFRLKMVVRPKHVADNLNKMVNNY
jgi:hypothetical protein